MFKEYSKLVQEMITVYYISTLYGGGLTRRKIKMMPYATQVDS